jgi:hypothetical protein
LKRKSQLEERSADGQSIKINAIVIAHDPFSHLTQAIDELLAYASA